MLVTLLTCAGALGIGPGAAMGETSPSTQPSASAPEPGGPAHGRPDHRSRSGSWVTVTDGPTSARQAPGKPPTRRTPSADTVDALSLPAHSGHGRRIVYDISAQRVWLVGRGGDVARTYLVSGSRNEHLLDPGRYSVSSMSRHAVSLDFKETMNYMVRFASGKHSAIGFHDIPAFEDGTLAESRSQLGTPQSDGCVRQWITDAKALWEFSSVGTRVIVTA